MKKTSAQDSQTFFKQGALSQRLFIWLAFKIWVNSAKSISRTSKDSESLDEVALLSRWREQSTDIINARSFQFIVLFCSFFAGIAVMFSLLALSFTDVINVWVPIALFAFVPFVFSVIALVRFWLPTAQSVPVMLQWIYRFKIFQSLRTQSRLVLPWLLAQLQWSSVAFLLGSLLGFGVIGVFQAVEFGWSSTFIESSETMATLFSAISLPWHWLVAAPSVEAFESLRISAFDYSSLDITVSLWPSVLMAIVVYGLLPKCLLGCLYSLRLKKRLEADIKNSGVISQFLNEQWQQATHNPLPTSQTFNESETLAIDFAKHECIGWQLLNTSIELTHNLGAARWSDDQAFLNDFAPLKTKALFLVVRSTQTPTGELADCVEMIQKKCAVSLYVINDGVDDSRMKEQLISWQAFAEKQGMKLYQEAAK